MSRVTVYHREYGCDTGCCGHIVDLGDQDEFFFAHPDDDTEVSKIDFVRELVTEAYGEEHVKDIDWEESYVHYW